MQSGECSQSLWHRKAGESGQPLHRFTGRPPVTNPFDLPSRLREGNGLLLSVQ